MFDRKYIIIGIDQGCIDTNLQESIDNVHVPEYEL